MNKINEVLMKLLFYIVDFTYFWQFSSSQKLDTWSGVMFLSRAGGRSVRHAQRGRESKDSLDERHRAGYPLVGREHEARKVGTCSWKAFNAKLRYWNFNKNSNTNGPCLLNAYYVLRAIHKLPHFNSLYNSLVLLLCPEKSSHRERKELPQVPQLCQNILTG